ncbi:response regulator transcription factor [uncultured Sanguibacteroides sp.]|uniref:response regulator transcription factor n=1 Tax=uncultured Sanguibacteroides sp. TaxID=1635151 RepID=UPI0025DDA373|nr:response regulator transcription factor [uncultured Sanguibacteroides sp.]
MKILIIEDEIDLADSIENYLSKEGHLCESANNYESALEKIHVYEYDCILVDITLPDGNGLSIVKKLKELHSNVAIIIISAKNSIHDKVNGLDIGADDYLAKPFHLSELNSRIKSVLRRVAFNGQNEFVYGEIKIQPDARFVYVNGNHVTLTPKEYDLLLYLIMNKNRVLTKEAIVEHLWGDYLGIGADSLDCVYTHVRNLRKKIMEHSDTDYIKTIYAVGYKFTLS